jgi:squalene-associated FAD-dependent desaturase
MGCCTNLAHFCKQAGIADQVETHRTLFFLDERGNVSRMSAAPFPAPLHLAPSFLYARYLTFGDKIRIARAMLALLSDSSDRPGQSFLDWLGQHGQSDRTIDRFWGLVLTSALNESIDRIDLRYARQVFLEGFLWNRQAFHVEIPRTPLSEFYGPALLKSLEQLGIDIRCNANVGSVRFEDHQPVGVTLRTGESIDADIVILAVAPHHVAGLVSLDEQERDPRFRQIARLESSPITSVHLWYDRDVMDQPHLVGVGRQVQWLFRRPASEGCYVQSVTSASRELSSHSTGEILSIIRGEVEEMLPRAKEAKLLHHRVVTERRATFSVKPGVDADRPAASWVGSSLLLAGDYIQTGWPATMEGAVRGGYLAAHAALHAHSSPPLIPSLPAEAMVRFLSRILSWGTRPSKRDSQT